jgi:hypothetical protein
VLLALDDERPRGLLAAEHFVIGIRPEEVLVDRGTEAKTTASTSSTTAAPPAA